MLHAVWNALAKRARDQLVFLWSSVSLASLVLVPVGRRGGGRPRPRGAGTAWALLTGLLIATYSIVDKAGVTRLHPLPYIALMGHGMSALLTPAVVRDRPALAREWRENWRTIAVASSINLTS